MHLSTSRKRSDAVDLTARRFAAFPMAAAKANTPLEASIP